MQSNWTRKSGLWVTDYDDTNFSNVFNTTLNTAINSSDLSIITDSIDLNADGFPYTVNGGGQIVIDQGGGNEEYINYSSHDGVTFIVPSGGRGQNSTSAVAHSAGESIYLRNKILAISTTGDIQRNDIGSKSWRDVSIETKMLHNAVSTSPIFIIYFRYTDSSNYYYAYFRHWQGGIYYLTVYKVVNGSLTNLITSFFNKTQTPGGNTYTVSVKGNKIDAEVVGKGAVSVTDNDLTQGTVGFSFSVPATLSSINYFKIGTPS